MKHPTFFIMMILTLLVTVHGAFALSLTDNLDFYYKLDDIGGNANDSRGNFTGLTTGIGYNATGKINTAFRLSTTNSYINFSSINYTDNVTFNMWVNSSTFPNAYNHYIGTNAPADAAYININVKSNGKLACFTKTTGSNPAYDGTGTYTLAANQWYMLTITYGSVDGLRCYVNGSLDANVTGSGTLAVAQGPIMVGQRQAGGRQINGTVDEIAIYHRILNTTEIAQLYNSGSGCAYNGCIIPDTTTTINVTLSNAVNGTNMGGVTFRNVTGSLTFNYFNITGAGFCVTYTGNGTGTNCTSGNGASTFYNVTNTTTVTGAQTITTSTYQALLQVSAYRLFLNTSISSFNGTNSQATNTTTTGTVLIKALSGSNNVKIDVAGNYSKNITCTGTTLTTTSCNATGIYDNIFTFQAKYKNGTLINNFTINTTNVTLGGLLYSTSTTNNTLSFPLLQGYAYNFKVYDPGLATENVTLPANASNNYYNFSLYRAQTVSITFLDETTNAVVNTSTITAEFISNDSSYNYTTTNGTLFVDLLTPEAYTIRYGANNYTTRFYSLTIDSGSFNALNLTLCPDTVCSSVTITVKDQFDNTLEGAIVKVLKYDVTVNGYTLQEVLTTNFEGQTESNLQINNEYYKFIIEYEGETVLTTLPTYVYGSTITFVVNLGSTGFEEYFSVNDLTGYIVSVTDNRYSFTWTDTDNTATQGCLYAYLQTMTATTLYNSSCVASAAGTTFVTLDNTTGKTYLLYGIVSKDGTDYTLDSDIVRFDTTLPAANSGIDLLILFLLLLAVIFVGVWNPTIAVVLAGATPFLLALTGLVNISIGVAGILLILSVIVAYIINR